MGNGGRILIVVAGVLAIHCSSRRDPRGVGTLAAGGLLCGVAIILPIQVGFPLDAQRGALPAGSDAKTLRRFACPEQAIKKGSKPTKAG
jgi:hypothetical protein